MDWNWDETSHKGTQVKKAGIKKLKDEWVWQPVKLDSKAQGYDGYQVGVILDGEANTCPYCKGKGERPKGSK